MRRLSAWLIYALLACWLGSEALGGTIAPFTDDASASSEISAGTIDLRVSDANEDFTDALVSHTWELKNALPGDPPVCGDVTLKNFGNRDASSVSISITNSGTGGVAMASEIIATTMTYGAGNDLLPLIDGGLDGHAGKSMRDLELLNGGSGITGQAGLFAAPPFGPDGTRAFVMCLQLHPDAPNSLQGQTWLGTVTFTLHQ